MPDCANRKQSITNALAGLDNQQLGLVETLRCSKPTLVGIDHAFSFPLAMARHAPEILNGGE